MSLLDRFETFSKELSTRFNTASFASLPVKQENPVSKTMSSTSSSSTSSDSSDEEEQPQTNGTVEETTDDTINGKSNDTIEDSSGQHIHSDPSVSTHKLPADHPVYMIDEARRYYKGQQPPFILTKRQDPKTVVIPTSTGHRARNPETAEIVLRSWGKSAFFWTLDLNGIRYIVKPYRGAPLAGQKYLRWAGPNVGFDENPIAFSQIDMKKMRSRYPAAFISQMTGSSEGTALPDSSQKRPRSASTSSSGTTEGDTEEQASDEAPPALEEHAIDVDPQLQTPAKPTNAETGTKKTVARPREKNALKKGMKPTRHSDLPKRIPFDDGDEAPEASRAKPSKRRKTEHAKTEHAAQSTINHKEATPPAPSRSASRHRASTSGVNGTERSSSVPAQIQATPGATQRRRSRSRRSRTSVSQHSPSTVFVLSNEKQHRTTLLVHHAGAPEYQPLKLSACPNVDQFFDKVLEMWQVESDYVDRVTVSFLWMEQGDLRRTMYMTNREACWEHLLECVDEAPCWEEDEMGGRCVLGVEIVGMQ